MHRRHLYELDGLEEARSGLTVHAYKKPIDFEYQVQRHLAAMWETRGSKCEMTKSEMEADIRQGLAVGQAWLWSEPQLELFDA